MTLCSSPVEGPKGRRHFNCWLGPSLKAGKPMPSWVYPLVVAWFALGMVANVSQTGMHVTRCMFDITWQFKIVWLQSLHAGDCYPHDSTCLLWSVWLIMCLSVYHYAIFRSVSSWFFTPLSKQCLGFCGSWRRWNCNLASCHRAWSLAGVGFMLLSWHRRLVSSLHACDHRWAGHFSASASLIKSRSSMIVLPHSPWTLESVWMTWWSRVKSSVINVTTGPVLQLNTIDVTNRAHVVIILPKTGVVAQTSVDVPALAPILLQFQIRWT